LLLGNGIETFAATDARFINEVITNQAPPLTGANSQWFVSVTNSNFEIYFSFAPYPSSDPSIPGANLALADFSSGGRGAVEAYDSTGGYTIPFTITSLVGHWFRSRLCLARSAARLRLPPFFGFDSI
jgi:hypothetical protein